MAYRKTISLEEEALEFLDSFGKENRSAYINSLLKREKQRLLEVDLLRANREEASDTEYRDELSAWDGTLMDGLDG